MAGTPDWRIGEARVAIAPAGVTDLSGPGWRGRFERMTFGAGFHMHLGRVTTSEDVVLPVSPGEGDPTISAYTATAGRAGLDMAGWPTVPLAPGAAILFSAAGGRGVFHIPGSQVVRFFSVAVAPALLIELLDRRIPDVLAPLIEAGGRETVVKARTLSAATQALIDALGEPGEGGALQRLHREAVAIRLLTEMVEAELAGPDEAPPALTRAEEAAVRAAHEALLADLRDAPSAASLAAAAGVPLRRFLRAFEAAHGSSPAQALRRARLAEGRRLVEAGGLPLKAVAWRVGYSHVNNFIAAFAEQYGAPPRRFSRQRLVAE